MQKREAAGLFENKRKGEKDSIFFTFSFGATDVTRTHDLLITNQLLYQLSYSSIYEKEGSPAFGL